MFCIMSTGKWLKCYSNINRGNWLNNVDGHVIQASFFQFYNSVA